jgi:hypothetical protein
MSRVAQHDWPPKMQTYSLQRHCSCRWSGISDIRTMLV